MIEYSIWITQLELFIYSLKVFVTTYFLVLIHLIFCSIWTLHNSLKINRIELKLLYSTSGQSDIEATTRLVVNYGRKIMTYHHPVFVSWNTTWQKTSLHCWFIINSLCRLTSIKVALSILYGNAGWIFFFVELISGRGI